MTLLKLSPQHTSLGAKLDDLLASRFLPARWAERVWSAAELPLRLQQCIRILKRDVQWRAYADDDRIFFAVARLCAERLSDATDSAMEVYFLDGNATVYSAGVWENDAQQGWWLDSILELSYDCDHGGWLGSMMSASRPTAPSAGPQYFAGHADIMAISAPCRPPHRD